MADDSLRSVTAPIHLIGGGREHTRKGPDPLLEAVFADARKPHPSVAYVGVASDDDRDFFGWLSGLFRQAGAGEVRLVPLASPRSDLSAARALLERCDLVFISGGDVEAGMRHLERHGLGSDLRNLHRDGKPLFGLSAGSIMLARCWVRWTDPRDDGSAEVFPCLGIAPLVCDTHAESDGWEELRTLLTLTGETVGLGIPGGAALRIGPDGALSALGRAIHRLGCRDGHVERLTDLAPR